MRHVFALVVLAGLAGCASDEYSKVPEPSGEWVSANPASLMVQAPPAPARRVAWRRQSGAVPPAAVQKTPITPPTRAASASDKVAAQ